MTTRDKNAIELRKLPWIKKVSSVGSEHRITTREGVLTVRVTHGVRINEDGEVLKGTKLKESILVPLPSYQISLPPIHHDVQMCLVKKPKVAGGQLYLYPTRYYPYPEESWSMRSEPCFGEYALDYQSAASPLERAMVMAMYLQNGKPDSTRHKGLGLFAYHMGLLPEEAVKRARV